MAWSITPHEVACIFVHMPVTALTCATSEHKKYNSLNLNHLDSIASYVARTVLSNFFKRRWIIWPVITIHLNTPHLTEFQKLDTRAYNICLPTRKCRTNFVNVSNNHPDPFPYIPLNPVITGAEFDMHRKRTVPQKFILKIVHYSIIESIKSVNKPNCVFIKHFNHLMAAKAWCQVE